MRRLFMISMLLLVFSAAACVGLNVTDDDLQTKADASRYVDELMQDFRDGKIGPNCPDVQWVHIPALLEYGKSTEIIGEDLSTGHARSIPSHPFSSAVQFKCSEGIFALWMVEAARLHTLNPDTTGLDSWPSLNPLIMRLNGDEASTTWNASNTAFQREVLDAYVSWWKAAKYKKMAASIDPLEGTGYKWI